MSGTAGFCLLTGCVILNRCTCCLVPSGLGILPNLLFVLFSTSHSETATCWCVTLFVSMWLSSCLWWCSRSSWSCIIIGCVSSAPAHHWTRIPAFDIHPRPILPLVTHTHSCTFRVVVLCVCKCACSLMALKIKQWLYYHKCLLDEQRSLGSRLVMTCAAQRSIIWAYVCWTHMISCLHPSAPFCVGGFDKKNWSVWQPYCRHLWRLNMMNNSEFLRGTRPHRI